MLGERRRREFLRWLGRLAGALVVPATGCDRTAARPSPRGVRAYDDETSFADQTAPGGEALPDGLDADDFTLYTRTPLTLETKRSRMQSETLTATSRLFVRNNLPMPHPKIVADADAWVLRVTGVQSERSFSLPELRALGSRTEVSVLQCSGHGRRFFPHGPSGSPWGVGAAGCVRWTGVPVSAVIEAAGGPVADARFLTATGGDPLPTLPPSIPPEMLLVERSVPLRKGLDDSILAWALGDVPIPLSHGGPLRLIVPGYYGVNNVKYVKTLACTATQSPAKIQQSGYRIRPIGETGGPDQPSMWRMDVKSWIHGPGADHEPVVAGPVTIHGVAFSGERGVSRVEVSVDDGKTWRDATLRGPDLGKNAWRPFVIRAELGAGPHRIASRATDSEGDRQPEHRVENERGYGNNAWRDMALQIEAFATQQDAVAARDRWLAEQRATAQERVVGELDAQATRGREVFMAEARPACGNCHALADADAGMNIGPNLDELAAPMAKVRAAVTNGVGVMQGYRDQLTPEQIDAVAHYVVEVARGR